MSAWKAGKVLWFDQVAGEGLVIAEDGSTFYVHEAAIVDKSSKAKAHPKLKDDSAVKFTVYDNGYLVQIDKIREV